MTTHWREKYGYSEDASAQASEKMADVIALIDQRLSDQEERGSRYLVGDGVSAADIYWATMSISVMVPPPEIMPVTKQNKGMLKFFAKNAQHPAIGDALTKRLQDHQQYILTTYCEAPAVLGGDLL